MTVATPDCVGSSVSRLAWRPEFALVGAAFFWLGAACVADWAGDPDYFHGWFVIPLALFFLWKRIACTTADGVTRSGANWAHGALLVSAVLVLPFEVGRLAPLVWRVFPWGIFGVVAVVSLAAMYLAGGRAWSKQMIFPLVFLATGIPWPTAFEQPLTLGLMGWIAASLAELLPAIGIPAERDGNTIVLLNCTVGVEEACSGVRSLQSAVMLGLAAGEIFLIGLRARVFVLVAGIILALATNFGRSLALTLAGAWGGPQTMDAMHDWLGVVALGVVGLGVFWLAAVLRRPADRTEVADQSIRSDVTEPIGRRLMSPILIGVLGVMLAHGWYFWNERMAGQSGTRMIRLTDSERVQEIPVPSGVASALGADEGAYGVLTLESGMQANGFEFYWSDSKNNAEQLYHRPDSCMPGGGWEFIGPQTTVWGRVGGRDVEWAVLPYEKRGQRALLLWAAWLDGIEIPFSEGGGSVVQRNAMWQLIRNGRRRFAYETAGFLVPYSGDDPPIEQAVAAAGEFFSER